MRIIIAFVVLLLSFPAQAARFSGDYLLGLCASDKNGKEVVFGGHMACQSYIAGVIDYNNLITSLGSSPSVEFCVPDNADFNLLQKQVAAYLYKNRGQHGAFNASPAVALALFNYYPCRKKK